MSDTINQIEMWDILDENCNKTGRLHKRSEQMQPSDYHLIVHIWIKNSNNEFLISKRSPEKQDFGNLWECTGGSVIAGEDSLTAALRETKEELGLTLNPSKGKIIYSYTRGNLHHGIVNTWLFCEDFDIKDVILQDGETCGAKWASKDDIFTMLNIGEFVPVECFEYIYDMFDKY